MNEQNSNFPHHYQIAPNPWKASELNYRLGSPDIKVRNQAQKELFDSFWLTPMIFRSRGIPPWFYSALSVQTPDATMIGKRPDERRVPSFALWNFEALPDDEKTRFGPALLALELSLYFNGPDVDKNKTRISRRIVDEIIRPYYIADTESWIATNEAQRIKRRNKIGAVSVSSLADIAYALREDSDKPKNTLLAPFIFGLMTGHSNLDEAVQKALDQRNLVVRKLAWMVGAPTGAILAYLTTRNLLGLPVGGLGGVGIINLLSRLYFGNFKQDIPAAASQIQGRFQELGLNSIHFIPSMMDAFDRRELFYIDENGDRQTIGKNLIDQKDRPLNLFLENFGLSNFNNDRAKSVLIRANLSDSKNPETIEFINLLMPEDYLIPQSELMRRVAALNQWRDELGRFEAQRFPLPPADQLIQIMEKWRDSRFTSVQMYDGDPSKNRNTVGGHYELMIALACPASLSLCNAYPEFSRVGEIESWTKMMDSENYGAQYQLEGGNLGTTGVDPLACLEFFKRFYRKNPSPQISKTILDMRKTVAETNFGGMRTPFSAIASSSLMGEMLPVASYWLREHNEGGGDSAVKIFVKAVDKYLISGFQNEDKLLQLLTVISSLKGYTLILKGLKPYYEGVTITKGYDRTEHPFDKASKNMKEALQVIVDGVIAKYGPNALLGDQPDIHFTTFIAWVAREAPEILAESLKVTDIGQQYEREGLAGSAEVPKVASFKNLYYIAKILLGNATSGLDDDQLQLYKPFVDLIFTQIDDLVKSGLVPASRTTVVRDEQYYTDAKTYTLYTVGILPEDALIKLFVTLNQSLNMALSTVESDMAGYYGLSGVRDDRLRTLRRNYETLRDLGLNARNKIIERSMTGDVLVKATEISEKAQQLSDKLSHDHTSGRGEVSGTAVIV